MNQDIYKISENTEISAEDSEWLKEEGLDIDFYINQLEKFAATGSFS